MPKITPRGKPEPTHTVTFTQEQYLRIKVAIGYVRAAAPTMTEAEAVGYMCSQFVLHSREVRPTMDPDEIPF